jgi:fructokinase
LNNSNIPTFKKEDWLCISGFIFVQRPSREATFFAIKQAKSVGSTVCVDANIRLDMWDDESLVIPTTLKALKEADIAKMSDDELLLLTNSKSVEEGVRKIKHWPSKVKIITLGVKGAILLTDKSEFQIKGYNVPTVDMTGAGDAFIGALVSKLMQLKSWTDDALIKAIKFSNACGALVVGKKGAMSALPDLETVNKFMTGDH